LSGIQNLHLFLALLWSADCRWKEVNSPFLSQSGSFADYTCQILAGKNIRFSKVVGYGNESDLSAADSWNIRPGQRNRLSSPVTSKGSKDGRRFYELARKIFQTKTDHPLERRPHRIGRARRFRHIPGIGRFTAGLGKPCSNKPVSSA